MFFLSQGNRPRFLFFFSTFSGSVCSRQTLEIWTARTIQSSTCWRCWRLFWWSGARTIPSTTRWHFGRLLAWGFSGVVGRRRRAKLARAAEAAKATCVVVAETRLLVFRAFLLHMHACHPMSGCLLKSCLNRIIVRCFLCPIRVVHTVSTTVTHVSDMEIQFVRGARHAS